MGELVKVCVYDTSRFSHAASSNRSSCSLGVGVVRIPLVYHTSIVVFGKEYSFDSTAGITVTPLHRMVGKPDKTHELGRTRKRMYEFEKFVENLRTYEPLLRNCQEFCLLRNCHEFCIKLCKFLEVEELPEYIRALPRLTRDTFVASQNGLIVASRTAARTLGVAQDGHKMSELVELYVYDLTRFCHASSNRSSSCSLGVEAVRIPHLVYHPTIVVFGKEYSFDRTAGITVTPLHRVVGKPDKTHELGRTRKGMNEFEKFVEDLRNIFQARNYEPLLRNRQKFCIKLCEFLELEGLPKSTRTLPQLAKDTSQTGLIVTARALGTTQNGHKMGELVELYVYDLARPIHASSRSYSSGVVGFTLYHTSIVAFGKEYSFNDTDGITAEPVGHEKAVPNKTHVLGSTMKTENELKKFLKALEMNTFTVEKYDFVKLNCQEFCIKLCEFLEVEGLPEYVRTLPQFAKDTFGSQTGLKVAGGAVGAVFGIAAIAGLVSGIMRIIPK